MGNASGREDGEGTSGVKYDEASEPDEMEFAAQGGGAHVSYGAHGAYPLRDPMAQPPPLYSPSVYQPPPMFSPQVPMVPLTRPSEIMHAQNNALVQNTTYLEDVRTEKRNAMMITWSYGGEQVAVTGSWDNWRKREALHRSGKDFIIMKMLPSGVYHYRFIVDEQLRYAPNLLWECDELGNAYNILDVQEYVPDALESLSEFESPSSPVSSYDSTPLTDDDFSKNPPDLPPQLQITLLNGSSFSIDNHQPLPRPQRAVLNHLYIQKGNGGQPAALGFTHRFLQKYVTVVLYKASQR